MGYAVTNYMYIKRGVRQGYILSPLLFKLYSDQTFNEAVEELADYGVEIN